MISESARMTSAKEAKFRVQAPNRKPRTIIVILLDRAGEWVLQGVANQPWNNAKFLTASDFSLAARNDEGIPADSWLKDLAGRTLSLTNELEPADLVVMVAIPGGNAQVAAIVGRACQLRHLNTAGIILGARSASEKDLSITLAHLRPWSRMVVVVEAEDYLDAMLMALQA